MHKLSHPHPHPHPKLEPRATYQRFPLSKSMEWVRIYIYSFACYTCWHDFCLPGFCLPWFIDLIFCQNIISDHKQWNVSYTVNNINNNNLDISIATCLWLKALPSQVTTVHGTMFNRPKTKNKINSLRKHEHKEAIKKAQTHRYWTQQHCTTVNINIRSITVHKHTHTHASTHTHRYTHTHTCTGLGSGFECSTERRGEFLTCF